MKIRRYQKDDEIEPLIRRAVEDIEPEYYSQEKQEHLEEVIPEMNLDFAEKDRYVYYVAEEEGEIVGVAGFQRESGTVAGIFVSPDRKNSGIGSKLLRNLQEKAREEGLEVMETLASLEAEDFYRKNGYSVVEERKQDIEGKEIGIKVMTKELKPEIIVRHAQPGDAEEIHEIALESWKYTYRYILSEETIEEVIDDWYSVEDLKEQAEHPIFYVAETREDLVGFVHASVEEDTATLHRIYLKPELQGKGIGSALYERAEKDIEKEADVIELEVLAENRKGRKFYEKQGYEVVKEEDIELKGEEATQLILEKEF